MADNSDRVKIYARIDSETALVVRRQCEELGITQQAFMTGAVSTVVGLFDVRLVLSNVKQECFEALQAGDVTQKELAEAQKELSQARADYAEVKASSDRAEEVIRAHQSQSWIARLFGMQPKLLKESSED